MKLATTRRWLIALTISAVPLALGVESLLRWLLLPADFDELRTWLEPPMTTAAWWLMGLCAVVGVACVLAQARWCRRSLSRLVPGAGDEAAERACIGVFIVTASLAQGPALLASLTFLLGARLLPVLLAVGWSTSSVTIQALRIKPLASGHG